MVCAWLLLIVSVTVCCFSQCGIARRAKSILHGAVPAGGQQQSGEYINNILESVVVECKRLHDNIVRQQMEHCALNHIRLMSYLNVLNYECVIDYLLLREFLLLRTRREKLLLMRVSVGKANNCII